MGAPEISLEGLTTEEADRRFNEFGPNEIPEKQVPENLLGFYPLTHFPHKRILFVLTQRLL
jgi:hypothetical protein